MTALSLRAAIMTANLCCAFATCFGGSRVSVDLVRILTEPKNALVKQYRKMFAFEDAKLVFEEQALHAIAHEAVERGTGARGLRAICERVLMDVMYELPEQEGPSWVTVRASDVAGETKPVITPLEKKEAA